MKSDSQLSVFVVVLGYRENTLKVPSCFNFVLQVRKDAYHSFIMMSKIPPVDATFLSAPVLNCKKYRNV